MPLATVLQLIDSIGLRRWSLQYLLRLVCERVVLLLVACPILIVQDVLEVELQCGQMEQYCIDLAVDNFILIYGTSMDAGFSRRECVNEV